MGVQVYDSCNIQKLYEVDTPLAALYVRYEWLMSSKGFGYLCLRQAL